MALDVLAIQDRATEGQLLALVENAILELQSLGDAPVLVAECPHKFNDVWFDDLWFGVQVGDAYWEQAQYFEEVLVPSTKETGRDSARANIVAAQKTLRKLNGAGWHTLVKQCLGDRMIDRGDVIGLALQFGQPWLCVASSNNDTEIALTVSRPHGLLHMARCSRFDQSLGEAVPLRFGSPRVDFARYLTAQARAHYFPQVKNMPASKELCALLRDAIRQIDLACTGGELVALWASDSYNPWAIEDKVPAYVRGGNDWAPIAKPTNATLEQLAEILSGLESTDWRSMVAKTTGVLKSHDSICLIRPPHRMPYLVWELTAFDFQMDTLRVLGLHDRVLLSHRDFSVIRTT